MLSELRTSLLGPRNYYDLYIMVTDELRHMEAFFEAEQKRGRRMLELYELVQHAGNVLPRLYLLLSVGSVYIMSKEAPAKDVLKDLVEMCRGVQHPMRGLFLRNYLSQMCKDKLPDVGSDYEGAGGTVGDSVAFILSNFNEMNKLWVRMPHPLGGVTPPHPTLRAAFSRWCTPLPSLPSVAGAHAAPGAGARAREARARALRPAHPRRHQPAPPQPARGRRARDLLGDGAAAGGSRPRPIRPRLPARTHTAPSSRPAATRHRETAAAASRPRPRPEPTRCLLTCRPTRTCVCVSRVCVSRVCRRCWSRWSTARTRSRSST